MATFIKGTDCGGCDGCTDDPCAPSPTAPAPTAYFRTVSGTRTKCGFDEWPGYESTPPRKYLKNTLSGSIQFTNYGAGCSGCVNDEIDTYSGTTEYAVPGCGSLVTEANVAQNYSPDCSSYSSTDVPTTEISDYGAGQQSVSYSGLVKTVTGTGSCVTSAITSGTATETLSVEYTTADLLSGIAGAMGAFSGSYSTTPSTAYYDLSTDELTATMRKLQYKFSIPSGLSGCYKIEWIERFSPEGGGSPTDTAKSYLWDGSATETGAYTIDVPATQGAVSIESVTASCDCA